MAPRGHTNIDAMRDESPSSVMNNYVAGLKTEFTGMNFPLNAATDCDNVIFTLKGDVTRRPGFDFEKNYKLENLADRSGAVVNTYIWRNAGGDGESILFVSQIGFYLYFYLCTAATTISPVSNHKLVSVVDISTFAVAGPDRSADCQFADGNGYLFGYCNACDPFYCTYDPIALTVTAAKIDVKIRDFTGLPEAGVDTTTRPTSLTQEHEYNLRNQGWTRAPLWSSSAVTTWSDITTNLQDVIPLSFTGNGATGAAPYLGNHTLQLVPGLPITVGTPVDINYSSSANVYDITAVQWSIRGFGGTATGVVISYDTTTGTMVLDVTSVDPQLLGSQYEISFASDPGGDLNGFEVGYTAPVVWSLKSSDSINTIDTWHRVIGNYPSNADIWWIFKNAKDEFDPATTIGNKGLPSAWAPKGHFITSAFDIDRVAVINTASPYGNTSITSITEVNTSKRPRTGGWFQGRVWYTGVDDSQQKTGDVNYTTWTENIYFSQIVEGVDDFGHCYEANDPTDQYSFNLLPSDGGVITIQGCGAIYKLFPIQNGMLVFAANGIWFITGSQGIGFSASDYTITKISAVRSISSNSYVDVNGLPIFWNEEGIYTVSPAQQGLGLTVNPLTIGTIKSYYDTIPYTAKKLARGSYNPVDYVAQWLYKDTAALSATGPAGGQQAATWTFYAYDDCCHLYTSVDNGNTWIETGTPNGTANGKLVSTMHDDWTDMQMALNDNDFETIGMIDLNVAVNYYDSATNADIPLSFGSDLQNKFYFPGTSAVPGSPGDSAIAIAPNYSVTGDVTETPLWNVSPSPTSKFLRFASAAIGNKGQIILVPSHTQAVFDGFTSGGAGYPRLSKNGGKTWQNITSVPVGGWSRACMSYNSTVMYMTLAGNPIYQSIDQGITWSVLASSPDSPVNNIDQNDERLRCDFNGGTVAVINSSGFSWSTDFGITWTTLTPTDFVAKGMRSSTVRAWDFGMTRDGNTFYVMWQTGDTNSSKGQNTWLFKSSDAGVTWSLITLPWNTDSRDKYTTSGTLRDRCYNVNVSPDGTGVIVVYVCSSFTDNLQAVDISTDSGVTWATKTFTLNSLGGGSSGAFVAAYAIPPYTVYDPANNTQVAIDNAVTDKSNYTNILNFNTHTGAFYPWSISTSDINGVAVPHVHSVDYIADPGGSDGPPAIFKYFTSVYDKVTGLYSYTFSECSDLTYVDWDYATETTGDNYNSYFVTGYALDGQGQRKFQPNYVFVYCRDPASVYTIQGIWDFAINGSSGQWSGKQKASFSASDIGKYSMVHKRHKMRGHGYTFQYKIASVDNNPFDIMGWSSWITENAGI